MALKQYDPAFQQAKGQVSPDEIDRYEIYTVQNPTTSATWVGTVAGTQTASAAVVLINTKLDYPRNLLYGIVGTADIGGSITVNGKDQFGQVVTERVGSGTAAAGTPAIAVAGTQIFSEITSGTVTFATSSGQGNGTARVGVAIGTSSTTKFWLGLPTKIGGTTDVKNITWSKEHVVTTMNGGTIAGFVNGTNHAIGGSAIMGGTEVYTVTYKPTYDNSFRANLAGR